MFYMIFSSEISILNKRLAESQKNNVSLQEEVKQLKLVFDEVELKTQQLQHSLQRENELQKETLGKREDFLHLKQKN